MAIVTVPEFETYLRGVVAADQVALLPGVLNAAHRTFYNLCQRTFEVVSGPATARVYLPSGGQILRIHDCTTVTAVTSNGSAVTDYVTEPKGVTWAGETRPIEQLRLATGWYQYGTPGEYSISVTGTWGWATAAPPVVEAIKVLGKDILANRDIRFGFVDFEASGVAAARRNPFVLSVVNDYRRLETIGIAG